MANMSYCRFENTLGDLRDCRENIDEPVFSREEAIARRQIVAIAHLIADEYEVDDFSKEPDGTDGGMINDKS